MLAGELALAGVDVVVVERRPESGALRRARARHLLAHHRSTRSARHRGSIPRGGTNRAGHGIRRHPTGHQRLPHPPQLRARRCGRSTSSASSPTGSTSSGCRSSTAARSRDSCSTTTAVDVTLADGQSVRAQYLVGCDGGRSLVRKTAGIDFPGWEPTTSSILAEVGDDGDAAVRRAPFGRRHVRVRQVGVRDQGRRNHLQGCRSDWSHGHRAEPELNDRADAATISRSC